MRYHLISLLRSLGEATAIRDVMLVFIAWIAVCAIECLYINGNNGSMPFRVLFEIVSCFGNVGLSLGVGECYDLDAEDCQYNDNDPLCAQLKHWSQIVLVIVMVIGRTRGMPTRMDAAFSTKVRRFVTCTNPHQPT